MIILLILGSNNLAPLEILAVCLAYFVAICVAMSFHEYAHSLAAYKNGDETPKMMGRLTLNPFAHFSASGLLSFFLIGFGWAKPVKINPLKFRNYRKGLIWTSLSGVLANLALAFVFAGVLHFLGPLIIAEFISSGSVLMFFLYQLIYLCLTLNLILFIFNLLPIYPLDGFNFISIFTKYNNRFIQFMTQYSFFIFVLLILPIFAGNSVLSLVISYVNPAILYVFNLFWGLFG
ncbi:MAG: site-2 protease family protein [Clostridia bacterium]|nr:site-2 protease family protein [Clostridia bacterium]